MTYDIYFGKIKIAAIYKPMIEFLNCYGNYVLDANFLNVYKDNLIMKMITFQLKNAESGEWEDEEFADFIESEAWFLQDKTGEKIPILVPIFNNKTDITWRYNLNGD